MTPLEINNRDSRYFTEYRATLITDKYFEQSEIKRLSVPENFLDLSLSLQSQYADYTTLKMLSSMQQRDILTWVETSLPYYEIEYKNNSFSVTKIADLAAMRKRLPWSSIKDSVIDLYDRMVYIRYKI